MRVVSRRIVARFALLALLPLALTACFRVDLAITVEDDGSGTMTMLVAFDESLLGLLDEMGDSADAEGDGDGGLPADPLELLGGIDAADFPAGVNVEPYRDGDFVGAVITIPFESTDNVAASLEEAFAASAEGSPLGGDSGTPLENFVLQREADGGWRFEASAAAPGGDEAGGLDAAVTRLLFADASFTVRMRLPGEVVETNADERGADGELVWRIDPTGDARTLSARTRPASGGVSASTALIAGAALATAIVVGALGYWVRRRTTGSEATGAA